MTGREATDRHAALAWTVMLILLAGTLLVELRAPMKDDVAWLLYFAERWFDGQVPYRDLIEVNPPMILWISSIPVAIGRLFGASPLIVAPLVFAALVVAPAFWAAVILCRERMFRDRTAVFAALVGVLLIVPAGEFGQREHMVAAALLPWLALRVAGARRASIEEVAAGFLVGVCCSAKPWYVLAFLATEFSSPRPASWRGSAPAGLALAGGLGLGIAWLVNPDYFSISVPFARAIYSAHGAEDGMFPPGALLLGACQCVLVALWWRARGQPERSRPLQTLLAFALSASLVFVLQSKGWFYHRIPATVITTLALLFWMAQNEWRGWGRRVELAFATLMIVALGVQAGHRMRERVMAAVSPSTSLEQRMAGYLRAQGANTYTAFSRTLSRGFPVTQMSGVVWTTHFPSMWLVIGERALYPADYAPLTHLVAEDFLEHRPDVVAVDTGDELNFPALLAAAHPDFGAAWSEYEPATSIDAVVMYRRRRDAGAVAPPSRSAPDIHIE